MTKELRKVEKRIAVVAREGLAVIYTEDKNNRSTTVQHENSSVQAGLNALEEVLKSIPTNENITGDFYSIYVPNMLNGIAYNAVGLYLRTEETKGERELSQEELERYVDIYQMYLERAFNCRMVNSNNISSKDTKGKNFVKSAWNALDRAEKRAARQPQQVIVQQAAPAAPDNSLAIATITDQIAQAAASGNIALVQALTATLQALNNAPAIAPAPVQVAPAPSINIGKDLGEPEVLPIDLEEEAAKNGEETLYEEI